MIGVNLQLFEGSSLEQADLSDIQALWWDVTEPKDMQIPIGKTTVATTDENGYINLDLSSSTKLSIGESGFLMLYKLDDADHKDSLVFSGKVATSDIVSGASMTNSFNLDWVRPTDWPALDALVDGVEKVQGVYAVHDIETAGNGVGFICEGDYHVDWGDGSNEDVASGVTVEHSFDFSNVNLSEVTSRNYKCAVITITPQDGSHLTNVNLNVRHSNFTHLCTAPWLDIVINSSYLTDLQISATTHYVYLGLLEQFTMDQHAVTSLPYMFSLCFGLQSVKISNLNTVTAANGLFYFCCSLHSLPPLDLSSLVVDGGGNLFIYCYSLRSITITDFSSAIGANELFYYCHSLQTASIANLSSMITTGNIFREAFSLRTVSIGGFSNALTNTQSMFYTLPSLQHVSHFETGSVLEADWMFADCDALRTLPLFNFSSATSLDGFCSSNSLKIIPAIDFSSSTKSADFTNCPSLSSALCFGMTDSFYITNTSLGPEALDLLYTNLGTTSDGFIDVSVCWGLGSDDPTIATDKGWTVVEV